MRKTKFQRLTALLLCLMFVVGCFSLPTFAAETDAAADAENENNTSTTDKSLAEIKELLNAISYENYIANAIAQGIPAATDTVVIDAADESNIVADKTDAKYSIGEYGGQTALYTPSLGSVSFKVNVPKTARYIIKIEYYAVEGKAAPVERVFKINDKVPFAEARYITLYKNWVNDYVDAEYTGKNGFASVKSAADAVGMTAYEKDGKAYVEYPSDGVWTSERSEFCESYGLRFMKTDINRNELKLESLQKPEWNTYVMKDSTGFYADDFEFALNEGENVITIEGKNEPMAIKSITLCPAESLNSYAEYIAKYQGVKNGTDKLKLEAEFTSATTDKTMYALEDRSSAANSPTDVSRTVLNTFGAEKWQTAGQAVSYTFKVNDSGMYDVITRFRQNILDGMYVNRAMAIYVVDDAGKGLKEGDRGYYNGAPFEEARALVYNFSDDWQVTKLTDGSAEDGYKIYFEAGVTYRIEFEVTLGKMGDIISTVSDSLDIINECYLSIMQLTGTNPDKYRDYGFSRIMPDTLTQMVLQARVLSDPDWEEKGREPGVAEVLTQLAGQKSSNVGTLQTVSQLLRMMGTDEDEIARNLARLKGYIGTLGTFLSDAKTQPLQLDYILIQSPEQETPRADANAWISFVHEIKSFFYSFFRDYNSMGATSESSAENGVKVWLAYGRDQSQVIRDLATNDFTATTDIAVDLKLVAAGTLLPSILAGEGPDVYLGLSQDDVINYAIRSAILPVEEFEDFDTVTESFTDAAMLVLRIEDANGVEHTYGLPETQSFPMMFVRTDILAENDIEIPKTWDDVMAAIPVLQAKNMEIGLTTEYRIFLYQMGGDLFADNGMRINLDSKVGLSSFEMMCNMFTMYKYPYQYDAANRFRTGEIPILIGDYTGLYNQLKVFATEIEGLWQFVPLPGMVDEDGNINNSSIATIAAVVMVKGAEEHKNEAWEYMKWYTGKECQTNYTNEMVAIMGPSAKHPTANIEALESLPWTADEYEQIKLQTDSLAAVPNYPGAYIIGRYTNFAFLAAYNEKADPSDSLYSYIPTINKEITRKRAEFGLETLDVDDVTLANRRLKQAQAAVDELRTRTSSYTELLAKVETAIGSEDIATLNDTSDEVMKYTQVYSDIKISRGPDITDFDESELLYYIAQALSDAAKAFSTY